VFGHLPRARLATLPTPLERGPELPGGVRLWVKRDDLTGLGMGGNKARKLEFLCGAAIANGARSLVTVGAGQSNHCRMTAAAGAVLGLEVHLVLAGDRPVHPTGNQLLSTLFGAQIHYTGAEESHWGELEIAREALTDDLTAGGAAPYAIPIGGSTAVGAVGYALAFVEMMEQFERVGIAPAAIVFTSSSGGTHAGLVAGRALWRERGHAVPEVLAIGVAKGVNMGMPDIRDLARGSVELLDADPSIIEREDVRIDPNWMGVDYAVPTKAGDAAIRWAARHGGWVLDRVYSGKGLAGLVGNTEAGRWPAGSDVVFIHTGGIPAVFTPQGVPPV
jgi:1-aminocyclopropane-1-carboxylate deaminase/D-cysteine desulfhydrase-like pyridoxal-dependent ACC family enzyme